MKNEENRLSSFTVKAWPLQTPSPQELAKSGFFYCLLNDTTQCAYCRCCIGGWKSDSIPNEVHKNLFPDCLHIKHLIQSNSFYNSGHNSAQEVNQSINIIENEVQSSSVINSKNSLMCKICYDFEISVRFNCKHLIACKSCSKKVQICPICRSIIRRRSDVIIC